MLDKFRHAAPVEHLRRALRDKLMRAVEDAVSRSTARQLDALREEVAELRAQVRNDVIAASDRVMEHTSNVDMRAHRDIFAAGNAEAALQSANFVREHMGAVKHFGHPHTTLEHGLSLAPEGGMALEFGVYSGTTLTIIAKNRAGEGVYGFDSFEGLPEDWREEFPAGAFATEPPQVPGAELVVGWFADTLPAFLAAHEGPVDFLHVDADLYSAAKTVLELVGPRLRPGSIVVFDEFFNYPGWQDHEHRAWQEYVAAAGIRFEYIAYTYDNEQVVVKVVGP